MTQGSVLVQQRGSKDPLRPGPWRTGEEREQWAEAGGELVCPSFSLPSGSWRDGHIGRAEGNGKS